MLVLTRKIGQSVVIADVVVLTVKKINSSYIQIAFDAPKSVKILRKELRDKKNANQLSLSINDIEQS